MFSYTLRLIYKFLKVDYRFKVCIVKNIFFAVKNDVMDAFLSTQLCDGRILINTVMWRMHSHQHSYVTDAFLSTQLCDGRILINTVMWRTHSYQHSYVTDAFLSTQLCDGHILINTVMWLTHSYQHSYMTDAFLSTLLCDAAVNKKCIRHQSAKRGM